ncbi:hypothetical protein GQ42DRAFT_19005 [Ramicandelaber brevisporus]|nr:hypothetical protein GQ42DRAFT_19005 [Ramicandelaber brevisporus]
MTKRPFSSSSLQLEERSTVAASESYEGDGITISSTLATAGGEPQEHTFEPPLRRPRMSTSDARSDGEFIQSPNVPAIPVAPPTVYLPMVSSPYVPIFSAPFVPFAPYMPYVPRNVNDSMMQPAGRVTATTTTTTTAAAAGTVITTAAPPPPVITTPMATHAMVAPMLYSSPSPISPPDITPHQYHYPHQYQYPYGYQYGHQHGYQHGYQYGHPYQQHYPIPAPHQQLQLQHHNHNQHHHQEQRAASSDSASVVDAVSRMDFGEVARIVASEQKIVERIFNFTHYSRRFELRRVCRLWYSLYNDKFKYVILDQISNKHRLEAFGVLYKLTHHGSRLKRMIVKPRFMWELFDLDGQLVSRVPNLARLDLGFGEIEDDEDSMDLAIPLNTNNINVTTVGSNNSNNGGSFRRTNSIKWFDWMDFVVCLDSLSTITMLGDPRNMSMEFWTMFDSQIATRPKLTSLFMHSVSIDPVHFPGPEMYNRSKLIRRLRLSVGTMRLPSQVAVTMLPFSQLSHLEVTDISDARVFSEVINIVTSSTKMPNLQEFYVGVESDVSQSYLPDHDIITPFNKLRDFNRPDLRLSVSMFAGSCLNYVPARIDIERDFLRNFFRQCIPRLIYIHLNNTPSSGDYDPVVTVLHHSIDKFEYLRGLKIGKFPNLRHRELVINALNDHARFPRLSRVYMKVDGEIQYHPVLDFKSLITGPKPQINLKGLPIAVV